MSTIRLEPDLVEAVITAELERNETGGDGALVRDYHALADPLYERVAEEERKSAFDRVYFLFFERLGFLRLLTEMRTESRESEEGEWPLLVLAARGRHEEGAVIGQDGRSVCLRILPSRFSNRRRLVAFLRHEFLHASDMLNPSFRYHADGRPSRNAERYRTIWCASVDARLERLGHQVLTTREAHRLEFDEQFVALPQARRDSVFAEIWNGDPISFPEILEITSETNARSSRPGGTPGAACPLCGFPTHSWAKLIEPSVAACIRADYGKWQAEEGACERCVERYRLLAPSTE